MGGHQENHFENIAPFVLPKFTCQEDMLPVVVKHLADRLPGKTVRAQKLCRLLVYQTFSLSCPLSSFLVEKIKKRVPFPRKRGNGKENRCDIVLLKHPPNRSPRVNGRDMLPVVQKNTGIVVLPKETDNR